MDSAHPTRFGWIRRRLARRPLAVAGGVLLAIAGALLAKVFSAWVPFNMDEYIHYNALICRIFPLSDIGDDACRLFDLLLPGTQWLAPIRAFHYSGSAPATYYFPLLLLWPSPLSARFLGLVFIFVEALLLARVMGTRTWLPLLGLLLFFPYAFQQIVDTGPVGFHMFSIFALYLLFGRWAQTLRPGYMVGAALLAAFCVWIKFSYFWLVPGIGILLLIQIVRNASWKLGPWRELVLQPLAAFTLAALPLVILISSVNPENHTERPYLDQLRTSETYTVQEMRQVPWKDTSIGQAMLKPMEASQRVFLVQPMPETLDLTYRVLAYLFVPVFVLLLALLRGSRGAWVPAALYLAFLSAVFMIFRTKASGPVHHAILAFPFLVLAAGETVRLLRERAGRIGTFLRVSAVVWFIVFLGVNLPYWRMMPSQPEHLASDASKDTLMRVLKDPQVANRYVIVVVDWGVYYILGLYGNPQQILLSRLDISGEEVQRLRTLAAERGRKLLFVHSQPETVTDLGLLRPFATAICDAVPSNARWQVIGEPDPILTEACERVARIGR